MKFPRWLLPAAFLGGMLLSAAPGAWAAEPKTTVDEVTGAIMSPVCPGKLLHDCPSAEGAQLRELVRRKVVAGETKDQIVKYFVDVYGISVLPKPPAEGFLLTAWLLPLAGLIGGFGVVFVMVRTWTARGRARRSRPPERPAAGARASGDPLDDRLRRELKDFGN